MTGASKNLKKESWSPGPWCSGVEPGGNKICIVFHWRTSEEFARFFSPRECKKNHLNLLSNNLTSRSRIRWDFIGLYLQPRWIAFLFWCGQGPRPYLWIEMAQVDWIITCVVQKPGFFNAQSCISLNWQLYPLDKDLWIERCPDRVNTRLMMPSSEPSSGRFLHPIAKPSFTI